MLSTQAGRCHENAAAGKCLFRRKVRCSVQSRESSAAHWNGNTNGRRKPRKALQWPEIFKISLLFSLFSVRHRALPELQGMKVGNSAPSSGMWQPTFLLGCDATRSSRDFTLPAAPAEQNRKVVGADGGQRQLHSEAGSEQNRAIESDSIAGDAIFRAVSLYFLSIVFGPDAALPLDDW